MVGGERPTGATAGGSADAHLQRRVGDLERANAALQRELEQQRELAAASRTSEAELQRLIEQMPQILWITRPDGWHVHYNQQWMDFTGLTLEASLGHGWNPAFHPDDRARAAARWEEATSTGEPYEIEYRLRRADGTYHWMLGRAMPLRDETGRIVKWFGTCTDIEELKQAQERIDEQAERLTTTLESITDAFFTVDRDWRLTYVNRRFEEILRRTRDELLGEDLWSSFPDAVGGVLDEVYHRAMRTGVSEVIDEFHWQPEQVWLSVHVYPSEMGLAVYFQDITAQHEARELLREREQQLARQAELLDRASDAIIVCDLDLRITYWNKSAERFYGVDAGAAIGRSIRDLIHRGWAGFDLAAATVLERGSWAGELDQPASSGSDLVVEGRWSLVRDDDGRPSAILAIHSDVTERKRVESQLLRAQRLESLGTLAGGIAHDINNVLAPILLATQMVKQAGPPAETTEMLDLIEQSAARGSEMVRRVLSFARGVDGQRVELDLGEIVHGVVRIARETFPRSVRVESAMPADPTCVRGDATQLHQVLMNLCINARDAMPDGGTLRLAIDTLTIDADHLVADQDAQPGPYVVVSVEDDGTGMDQTTMDRMFEPFYSTKAHGAGTGLGLSTSHGIVRSHGGFFDVHSKPGAGSRFDVYLPAADSDVSTSPVAAATLEPPSGNGEVVLLVDDEATTRVAARHALEGAGYQVIEAEDGSEAVPIFDAEQDRIDLLLTDMMMPQMDGPATIRAIRSRQPDLPVVAISGLISGREASQATELGISRIVPKPFSAAMLLTALGDALRH